MRIAFFEIQKWEKEKLEKSLKGHKLKFFPDFLTEKNINKIKDCEIISVFIYSKIGREFLEKLPNLKYIVTRSMGFDHIDIETCNKLKIKVLNTPHYGDNSVAEHTFGLILSLTRNIHKAYLRNLNENHAIEGLKGIDLKGKTLGVVGVGRIGSKVVKIARGFEMEVIATDSHPDKSFAKNLGFRYVPLKELLKKSDIISLHVPYKKENHHLINKKTLAMMKKDALLINTSRGQIVNTPDLMNALKKGKLGGAGLDVIEGEELIKEEKEFLHTHKKLDLKKIHQLALDHDIIKNEKVVFTPHIAFYSEEAIQRILEITIQDIKSCAENKPINLIK